MANKTIKGITIALGADFSAVGKAVDGIDKKFRSMQTELRQVDKLLKLDPKNTELLAQKQDLLAQSIQGTRDRLTALQSAQEKVNKAFQEGKIDESQYRAYQREIAATEQTLKNLEKQEKETADAIEHANDKVKASAKEVEAAKDSIKKVGDDIENVAEKAGKGLLTIGTAVAGAGTYCLNFSTDFDKALNNVITKTGATAQETAGLEEVMESVYSNNFGEDIADVGNSVATVKQQMKLAGEELQATTENALLLRDTFDFEVNESTRAAKMLMDQFDISAKEAFTLIAQGAQNGLDKNGDLLDTINEYSVHFKQAGFDAESMFNMLINGTESGTFSVDKLGDTVKEFFIRAKDGSDSTIGAFQKLGLNANKMTKKFAEGGTSAYEAYQTVNEALFNLNDTVKQNEIGVALYGTMWEDLGADGVQALTNIDGAADQAANTLEQINKTQYDDLGSSLETLGRTLNTEIIKPLGDKLAPYVKDLAEEIKDHAPEIKDAIKDIAGKAKELISYVIDHKQETINVITGIAGTLAAVKITKTLGEIAGGVKNIVGAAKSLKDIAGKSSLLGEVKGLSKFLGPVAIGLGAYSTALYALETPYRKAREEAEKFNQTTKEQVGDVFDSLAQRIQNFKEGVENAGSIYDGFNTSILLSEEKQIEMAEEMDEAQSKITELAQKATDERGKLTDEEIKRIDELLGKIQNIASEELKSFQTLQQGTIDLSKEALENGTLDESTVQRLLYTGNENYQNALDSNTRTYNERFLQAKKLYDSGAVDEQGNLIYTDEWFAEQKEQILNDFNEANKEIEDRFSELGTVMGNYESENYKHMVNNLSNVVMMNDKYETERIGHQKIEDKINDQAEKSSSSFGGAMAMQKRRLDEESTRHQNRQAAINKAIITNLDQTTQDQIAYQLEIIDQTVRNGGQLTDEQKKIAGLLVSVFQNVPEELRGKADEMMAALSMGLDENGELVFTSGERAGQKVADAYGLSMDDIPGMTDEAITQASEKMSNATLDGPTVGDIKYQDAVEKAKKDMDEWWDDHPIMIKPSFFEPEWLQPFKKEFPDVYANTRMMYKQNAKGGVFNRETLIGYTVGEAGREAILPLNRQVYSEIGEGVLRSMREKSMREITEPIRRMWEEDSIRVSAAYAATAAPPSPVNRVQAPVINQTNNITAPTPLSPYETARQVKIASQSLAWR